MSALPERAFRSEPPASGDLRSGQPPGAEERRTAVASGETASRAQPRLRWWHETMLIAAFYFLYSLVRDLRGKKPVSVAQADTNADRIISLEKHLHVFVEQHVQHAFLHLRWLMELLDDYYGTAHFVAVVIVLLLLFFRYPDRYRLWRNTLALTTGVALVGFAFFPLLPPRLLGPPYHFVDTLRVIGGLWNFSSGPVNSVSNQYAAMPSLHTAWAVWCAAAVIPLIRPWWGKVLVGVYPVLTVFCIVVTGNHYFADAAGGLIALGASYLVARWLTDKVVAVRWPWSGHRVHAG